MCALLAALLTGTVSNTIEVCQKELSKMMLRSGMNLSPHSLINPKYLLISSTMVLQSNGQSMTGEMQTLLTNVASVI